MKITRQKKVHPFSLREKARKREYIRQLPLFGPLSPTLSLRERGTVGSLPVLQKLFQVWLVFGHKFCAHLFTNLLVLTGADVTAD
jgi:hypothetical protein